jgi:hypothetical protein
MVFLKKCRKWFLEYSICTFVALIVLTFYIANCTKLKSVNRCSQKREKLYFIQSTEHICVNNCMPVSLLSRYLFFVRKPLHVS